MRDMYDRHEITLGAEDHCDIEIQGEYEGMCPLCGAEIEYDGYHEMDDLGGLFSWGCPQCGAHGEEGYSRKFDGHYHVEKGSKEIQ